MSYRQDLVPLLQSAVQSCSSIFFNFGHINAVVIGNILLVNTSNYVESQTWKNRQTNNLTGLGKPCKLEGLEAAQMGFQRQMHHQTMMFMTAPSNQLALMATGWEAKVTVTLKRFRPGRLSTSD